MKQQMNFGTGPSPGAAIHESEAVLEDGVWKFSRLHAYNTFTAACDGGWAHSPSRTLPGISDAFPPDAPPTVAFAMFPDVYDIPCHYSNPVTGR